MQEICENLNFPAQIKYVNSRSFKKYIFAFIIWNTYLSQLLRKKTSKNPTKVLGFQKSL
jgi:hypothetical protein